MHIRENREEYLNAEAKAVRECERLGVLESILLQASVLYKLGSVLMCKSITKHSTELCIKITLVDSTNVINIFYRNNIKLCREVVFATDNFEEIFS